MIKEMIKEIEAMKDCRLVKPTLAYDAIAYLEVDDINEIEDFESMSVTEAVDYVLDIVRSI